jgi:hypothetical protein
MYTDIESAVFVVNGIDISPSISESFICLDIDLYMVSTEMVGLSVCISFSNRATIVTPVFNTSAGRENDDVLVFHLL